MNTSKPVRPYVSERLRERSRHLVEVLQLGVRIIVALIGIGFVSSEFIRSQAQADSLSDYLSLILLTLTGLMIPYWIWVLTRELNLLLEWLDPDKYQPPSDVRQLLDALGIAVLLVVMVVSVRDPIWYGICYSITTAWVLLLVATQVNPEVTEAISGSRHHLNRIKAAGQAEIEYFLKRPHLRRYWINLAGGAAGLALAIYSKKMGDEVIRAVAYCIFLALIVYGEIWIVSWRLSRDKALRALSAELAEPDLI